MLVYLAIPMFTDDIDQVSKADTTNFQTAKNNNTGEAYVIVTINKKHFLSRFASYIPVEIPGPMERITTKRPVERVLMKIKPAKGKQKVEDFTIKPAPLE